MGKKNKRRTLKQKVSDQQRTKSPPVVPPSTGEGEHVSGLEMGRHMTEMKNMLASSIIDQISGNASTSQGRSALARKLGYEYQGDRDVYTALGYSKSLDFEDYLARYRRGDIGRRIINAPVRSTWRDVPVVNEVVEEERQALERTPFEKAWDALVQDKHLKIFHNMRKIDEISGIGMWGALFLGFDDVADKVDFANPVEVNSKLLYLSSLNELQAQPSTLVDDEADPRFGLPEFYQVQFARPVVQSSSSGRGKAIEEASSETARVHWSRMIHVAEEAEDDGVIGTPRLQAVFNRLIDMDRVVGGTGESFWRNAFPGIQFKLEEGAQTTDTQDLDELRSTIDSFMHRWERYIRTKGIEINQLEAQVAPPKQSFEVILSIIAGTTSIPQRILVGSERGELASTQDQTAWGMVIEERREQHVEPVILDSFITRMILVGILPAAVSWVYEWPPSVMPNEKDQAEVASKLTEALVKYADSIAAGDVIPLSVYLRSDKFMGFSEEEALKIEETLGRQATDAMSAIEDENSQIADDSVNVDQALEVVA